MTRGGLGYTHRMELPRGQLLRADTFTADETLSCDVVVIGTGAGGAAAGVQLAEAGLSVVFLEEGLKWEPHELSNKQSWAVRNIYAERGTSLAIGNIFIPMPRGKAVGGTTLINSGICFRTPPAVLSRWREQYGVPWANEAGLASTFDEVERAVGATRTDESVWRRHNELFRNGCEALKLEGHSAIVRNAPGCIGCGLCQVEGQLEKFRYRLRHSAPFHRTSADTPAPQPRVLALRAAAWPLFDQPEEWPLLLMGGG